MLADPIRPIHATPGNIPVLATLYSLDTINTNIPFTILPSFPSFGNLIILATPSTQPILANLLIHLLSLACILLLLLFITIYRFATFPTLAKLII